MKEFTTSARVIYISGINDLTINNDTNLCREYKQITERTNTVRKKKFDLVKAAAKLGLTENTKDLSDKISALATKYGINYKAAQNALFNMWKFGWIDGHNKSATFKKVVPISCSIVDTTNGNRWNAEDGAYVTFKDNANEEYKITFNCRARIHENSTRLALGTKKLSELTEKDKMNIVGFYLRNSYSDTLRKFNISPAILSKILRQQACNPKTKRGMVYTDAMMKSNSYVLAKRANAKIHKDYKTVGGKNKRLDKLVTKMSAIQLAALYQAADNVLNGGNTPLFKSHSNSHPMDGARLRARIRAAE